MNTVTETTRLPALTGKRPMELPETTALIVRSIRPCLSWTEVAEKAHVPLQTLVQCRVISPKDRKDFLSELIPQTTNEQVADGGKAWTNSTICKLIQRVRHIADACGIELRAPILQKRYYCSEDFQRVSEQLAKVYQECVKSAFSGKASKDSAALRHFLQCQDQNLLKHLHDFFSERTYLLEEPDFRNTLRQFIETHWKWALKAIRPIPILVKELEAGQALLRQIAPETLKTCVAICQDQMSVMLEAADFAVLVEVSEHFKADPQDVFLTIGSEDLRLLCSCYLKGEDPSLEQLGALFLVADKLSVEGLLPRCLEWLRTCDKCGHSETDLVDNICLLEQRMKANLLPATYQIWSRARDEFISHLLTRRPQLMQRIADFQGAFIYWPTSLELGVHIQRLPLLALEHLTLRSQHGKLTQKMCDQIGKMSRLKTLMVDMPPDMFGNSPCNWNYLRNLPELRSLSAITRGHIHNPHYDLQFGETVASLSQLEALSITHFTGDVPLLDIQRMHALRKLKIENTWKLTECSKFLSHPSLKTLIIDKARFEPNEGDFSIQIDILQSSMEVELSPNAKKQFLVDSEALIVRFKKSFPTIKNIRIKGV